MTTSPRNSESILLGPSRYAQKPQPSPQIAEPDTDSGELQHVFIVEWGNGDRKWEGADRVSGCLSFDFLAPFTPAEEEEDW